jgi:hypothetical protein
MQGCRSKPTARWSNRRLTLAPIAAIIAAMFGRILVVDNANDNNDEA